MGKVASAEMKQKKKERLAKTQIPLAEPRNPIILGSPPITYSRSHRRKPKYFKLSSPDFDDGDDDDERKEKKVKLVDHLPEETPKIDQNQQQKKKAQEHSASESGSEPESDSEPESAEDHDARGKKQKINAGDRGSDGSGSAQEKKDVKVTDTEKHGSPLESGPTTTLPDKKLLVFILDRLQKKDTYGVFSEPVDVDELPDYFEVIEQPMDFGTVRKKLDSGAYKKLDELEADVFLICSNAMLYNAEDTVYYRQARSIQEIAKRDFENLRLGGDNGEPKVVRRGRPPNSKNQKKPLETSPLGRAGADPSSGATPTNGVDKAGYNLRKAPAYRYRDSYFSSNRPRNGENEPSGEWNNEFPASILKADMKHGKRQIKIDENRRHTYRQFQCQSSANNNSSPFANSMGDTKQLVTVGLQDPLAYARSLARFAANLGPVAWEVARKKIEYVLPPGTEFGPGWVSETAAAASSQPPLPPPPSFLNNPAVNCRPSASSPSIPHGPSKQMIEPMGRVNSRNEYTLQGNISSWKTPFPQVQQNYMYQPQMQPQIQRNSYSGMLGYEASSSRLGMPTQHSAMEGFQFPPQPINPMLSNYLPALNHALFQGANKFQELSNPISLPHQQGETSMYGRSSWLAGPSQHGQGLAGSMWPNLNMRVPVGPPGLNLQIGSPQQQQPDLALQL